MDVIVVGAGLSGLAAARRLVRHGASVAVLEARDRVGGRTYTVNREGTFIDVGGQFIGPTQDRIIALSKAVGVKKFKPFHSGDNLFDYNGKVSHWTGDVPPLPTEDLTEYVLAGATLDHMAKEVPSEAPYDAPNAKQWDWQTYQSWLDDNVSTAGARMLFTVGGWGTAVNPGELSLLTELVTRNVAPHTKKDNPETWRFVGGAQQVSIRAAKSLGGRVVLNAAVRSLKHSGGSVVADSAAGSFRAGHAIVALAPTMAMRIHYDPPLSALRDGWTQHYAQGSVIKCQAIYKTPFWRGQGLSGHVISDRPPLFLMFDNGPPLPKARPGILLGFTTPDATRRLGLLSAGARRRIVLEAFARLFGNRALAPLAYIEGNWSAEQWTRGCYGGIPTPGAWVGFGRASRAPVGRIRWAATETSLRWPGYMDGAVRAGEAAADAVLASGAAVAVG